MWHVEEETMITSEYHLSVDLSTRLDRASITLEADKEEIVAQALREFFEKHGIRATAVEA
ncbi:MAG: hypothetical protein HOH43_24800 [Candidatus Latescibacteria bacterium]|nr:hypothetical protein [Candidatus Latescibacterota bacterium]